jgi:small conductance mechanosensitive channel
VLLGIAAHLIVREIRRFIQWILGQDEGEQVSVRDSFARNYPKLASLMTILVSAFTFTIYFITLGLILRELNVSLTKYLASASVIGLAIGFGSQGLVQDVVIGLTLIFSEAVNIEDVVEISGQVGRVENIGLRFTTLVNLHGQKINIPNRTIGTIGRFRGGCIRAYVDVQIPDEIDEKKVIAEVESIARGMFSQYGAIILTEPELMGIKHAESGNWQYLRVKFRLWPGQGGLIETTFRQRVTAVIKKMHPDYADWMVTVNYRTE